MLAADAAGKSLRELQFLPRVSLNVQLQVLKFTCLTDTPVRILTYFAELGKRDEPVLTLLDLLVQQYKY